MNDDQRLLASGALDGTLTTDERARAVADPDVVAEIARYQAVRDALRDTPAPDPDQRDAVIAAALAALDSAPAAAVPSIPVAPVVPLSRLRHRRWYGPVLAAAAAVVVIAGGVVVLNRGGADDSDSASLVAEDEAPAATASPLSASVPAPASAADRAAGAIPEAPAAPAEADDAASSATAPPTGGAGATDATSADVVVLDSPAALAAFAADAADHPPLDGITACGQGRLVGTARYRVDGRPVPVEVVRLDGGDIAAIALDSCTVVARMPP